MPLSSREKPFQASGPNIETNIKLLNIQHSSTLFIEKKGFYCATLCVNAVFAVARCPSVCLSVRLSRSCIVFRRLKISSNFILGPVAPSFYFLTPCVDTKFRGELRHWGAKYTGGGGKIL